MVYKQLKMLSTELSKRQRMCLSDLLPNFAFYYKENIYLKTFHGHSRFNIFQNVPFNVPSPFSHFSESAGENVCLHIFDKQDHLHQGLFLLG